MGLGFLFTAQDLASGVMGNVGKNLKGLEESSGKSFGNVDEMVGKMGVGLTTAAIGVGGLAATFAISGKAGEFELALAAVGAVSQASATDLASLKKAAMDAGKATQFSPTQAVVGLNELAQAGYNAQESIKLLNPVLDLAAGSLGDLSPAEAAGLAAQALKAFGIDAQFAGNAVDQMLGASNMFAIRAADLPLGLGAASRGAQTLNQSLTETLVAFGLVKNAVPGTEKAATAASSAMEKMADPKIQAAMKKLGVSVVDGSGNYRQFMDIVAELQPELDKMTEAKKGAWLVDNMGKDAMTALIPIFGQLSTGIRGADGVTRKGKEAATQLRLEMSKMNGVAKDFSTALLDTFEGKKTLFVGSAETLAIAIGEPFMNIWTPIIVKATDVVNGMIGALEGVDPIVKTVAAAAVVGSFALLFLAGSILTVNAALPILKTGLAAAGVQLGIVATATNAVIWPFVLAAAVIGVLVYAIMNNIWGLGDAWDAVVAGFQVAGEWLGNVFDKIVAYVAPLWDSFSAGFGEVIGPTFKMLKATIGELWDTIVQLWDTIKPIFALFAEALSPIADAFGGLGDKMDETTSGPGEGMLTFFRVCGWVISTVFAALLVPIQMVAWAFKTLINGIVLGLNFVMPLIKVLAEILRVVAESATSAFRFVGGLFGFGGDDEVEKATGRGMNPATAVKPRPLTQSVESTPATAAATAEAAAANSTDLFGTPLDFEKLATVLNKRPVKVELQIDNEKIATAFAKGKRSLSARQSGGDQEEED